jgi:hypothetical protein
MGLKRDAIGNTLGEHIENLGNILGTKGKMKKNPPPHPNPKLKRKKKSRHFECMLSLPIG